VSDGRPEDPSEEDDQLERLAIWGDLDATPIARREQAEEAQPESPKTRLDRRGLALKIALAFVGVWVFLVALAFMKDGARGLAPALSAAVDSPLNALGLGWLGALLVLSGSPVAASSLALFDGGSLTLEQSYAMIVGSRLGASFVVLVIGTIYALRRTRTGRRAPVSIGVVALTMTFITYIPGSLLGWGILASGVPASLPLTPPTVILDAAEALTAPVVGLVELVLRPDAALPSALLFLVGVGLLLASFRVVDAFLPDLGAGRDSERARWHVGTWTMFGIGLATALATLSVAVALSLLVPVVAKGYVKREQILPYIAGANITTLFDTLVVAVLLGGVLGPAMVLSLAAGVTAWTMVLLLLVYRPMRDAVFRFQAIVLHTRARLLVFVVVLFAIPTAMLLAGH